MKAKSTKLTPAQRRRVDNALQLVNALDKANNKVDTLMARLDGMEIALESALEQQDKLENRLQRAKAALKTPGEIAAYEAGCGFDA